MASPGKKDEFMEALKQLSVQQKWLAIAYPYVHNMSDAKDVFQDSFTDLLNQKTRLP